jgi:hypothetical protein
MVLREHDRPGAANIGLIDLTARHALDAGYHVVVEGILYADRYGDMLARLRADHRGPTHGYYLDVPFDETLARHATKPIADDVNETQLRDWYRPRDLLPDGSRPSSVPTAPCTRPSTASCSTPAWPTCPHSTADQGTAETEVAQSIALGVALGVAPGVATDVARALPASRDSPRSRMCGQCAEWPALRRTRGRRSQKRSSGEHSSAIVVVTRRNSLP